MFCTNWGCGQPFVEDPNQDKSLIKKDCKHHPGVYQFGSEKGLWPESWTCCRQEWFEEGCRYGIHRGVAKDYPVKFCINHGDPNPKSIYPDSFCGSQFVPIEEKPEWKKAAGEEDDMSGMKCMIHSGFLKVNKIAKTYLWTCCQEEDAGAPPCSELKHKSAQWPDEEAKLYFYNKPILDSHDKISKEQEFRNFGRFCGVFRKTETYAEKNPVKAPKISSDD